MNKQYFRDTTLLVAARISNILLGIITGGLTSRWLGPEGKGQLALLSSMTSLTIVFGHLGVGDANLFHLGSGKFNARRLLDHSVGLGFILGSFYFLIGYVIYEVFQPAILADIPALAFVLALLSLPFTLSQKYVFWVILGMKKTHLRWAVTVLEGLLRVLLVFSLVLMGKMEVANVMVTALIVSFAAFATATYFASRETGLVPKLDLPLVRASVGFGMMPYLVACVINLILRSDVFLVKYFLDSTQLGFYSVGTNIAEKIWILPEALSMALFAHAAREQGQGVQNSKRSMTPQIVRFSAFCTALACLALILFAPIVILLINGPAFEPSINAFRMLMPGVAMMAIYQLINADLAARRRADITFYAFLIGFLVNLGLNLYLIPRWGILGAAFSSSVAYGLATGIQAFRYCRLTGVTLIELLVVTPRDFRLVTEGLLSFRRNRAGLPGPEK